MNNHNSNDKTVVRIAPSPTGKFQVGNARTALFNFLYAKNTNGKIVLRIEDTDKKRSSLEYEKNILESLSWLGITHDVFVRQSERSDFYKNRLQELIEKDKAYISNEPGKNDPNKTLDIVRLHNPGKLITFSDTLRGKITFDTTDLGDFIIARTITEPLYHFVVVADDADQGVTDVIRGDDHISNTPRQILIQEALEVGSPKYTHLPLLLAPDKSKLSKRHGALSISDCMEEYLSEAVVNYLALLGWNPGTPQEIFTIKELVELFSLTRLQKSGAVFNTDKLRSINQVYLRNLSADILLSKLVEALPGQIKKLDGFSEKRLIKILPLLTERAHTLKDIVDSFESNELLYYFIYPDVSKDELSWKDTTFQKTKDHLEEIVSLLEEIPSKIFESKNIKEKIMPYADKEGRGEVLWPMRFALSGKEKSPDPFDLASVFGKTETLVRLKKASATIK